MANRQSEAVLQGLCKLAESHDQMTDGQLLSRFVADRNEGAFAALLRRYSTLVYGVCRNVLRHEQDAEDAFQATFLVLVRLAGAIRDERALGSWLYRVAYRVAMRARRSATRRRQQEERVARSPEAPASSELAWRELQAMLDGELNRLPEKYRAPFVLCCLLGQSKSEAAAELGWKEGTVSSRLAQARELLRARLARRGVTLSALLSGLALVRGSAGATVPAALLATTQKAALAFAAGEVIPAARVPVTLARSVGGGTVPARLKVAAAALVLVGLVGAAAAVSLRPAPVPDVPPPVEIAAAPPARDGPAPPEPAPAPAPVPAPAPRGRMTVDGSVFGADGRPVRGARVSVVATRRRQPGELLPLMSTMQTLGEGQTDELGLFRLSVPQVPPDHYRLTAVATAPGHALSSHTVDPATVTAGAHSFPLQLAPVQTVRGRLVDHAGRSAERVELHVLGLRREGPAGVFMQYSAPPVPIPGWPEPVTTDERGNFTLAAIAADTQVFLQVRDERFAPSWLVVRTGKDEHPAPVTLILAPARVLEGLITAEDTRRPLPGTTVLVETFVPGTPPGLVETKTDREGRYRIRPFPGNRVSLWVYPAPEQPYLALQKDLQWGGDAGERYECDLPVPRGVPIRGTVLEADSRRGVAGAAVSYEWAFNNNPFRTALAARRQAQWQARDTRTAADGSFTLTVPPGPGTLLVKAAEPDYVHVEIGSGRLSGVGPGGTPYFPDAVRALALQPESPVQQPVLELHRGVTVRGRVLGSDGKPVDSAILLSPTYVPDGFEAKGQALPVRDGRFELPGCAPGAKVTVFVYDQQKKEGAVAELTIGAAEPEVRLAPCVCARARAGGRPGPFPAARMMTGLFLRPGADVNESLRTGRPAGLIVWTVPYLGRDQKPIDSKPGEVFFPNLIPGATYTVRGEGPIAWLEKTKFTAPATGERDLGEIALDPPRGQK
jgi:RNA polymerase sigma factor (sigma-70 family)